jgi:O-methyltransferase
MVFDGITGGGADRMAHDLKTRGKRFIKDLLGRNQFFAHEMYTVYPYMFDPDQLMFIASSLQEMHSVEGACVEIGCAQGATTAFVNRMLQQQGVRRRYVAIDTFEGFPVEQSDYEVNARGKPAHIKQSFTVNRPAWVEKSLALAGVRGVELITADAATYDYSALKPIAWCLLDVDLYLPIRAALPGIYDALAPGGLIIIDDCQEDERWDGALQAYDEFVRERGLPRTIVHRKLGLIRK